MAAVLDAALDKTEYAPGEPVLLTASDVNIPYTVTVDWGPFGSKALTAAIVDEPTVSDNLDGTWTKVDSDGTTSHWQSVAPTPAPPS